jgi:hypothetical protein
MGWRPGAHQRPAAIATTAHVDPNTLHGDQFHAALRATHRPPDRDWGCSEGTRPLYNAENDLNAA